MRIDPARTDDIAVYVSFAEAAQAMLRCAGSRSGYRPRMPNIEGQSNLSRLPDPCSAFTTIRDRSHFSS
jgi:hypothetical protein